MKANISTGIFANKLYLAGGIRRKGDWKLYVNEKSKLLYLFNIATDKEEKIDLSAQQPAKLKELLDELRQWEKKNTIKPLWPSAADVIIDVRGKKVRFPS